MNQCIKFILFQNDTLHVLDGFSVHHQEFKTTYSNQTDNAVCLLANRQQYLFDIRLLLYVQSRTPDDGRKDCPKHIEFHSKNKFEKLVHLFVAVDVMRMGEGREAYRVFVGKPEGKRPVWRPRRRWVSSNGAPLGSLDSYPPGPKLKKSGVQK